MSINVNIIVSIIISMQLLTHSYYIEAMESSSVSYTIVEIVENSIIETEDFQEDVIPEEIPGFPSCNFILNLSFNHFIFLSTPATGIDIPPES